MSERNRVRIVKQSEENWNDIQDRASRLMPGPYIKEYLKVIERNGIFECNIKPNSYFIKNDF